MARTYRINGTLALKPIEQTSRRATVIPMPPTAVSVRPARQSAGLFDKDLTVADVLDTPQGFSPFKSAADRFTAFAVGTSSIAIFFFLTFITSI